MTASAPDTSIGFDKSRNFAGGAWVVIAESNFTVISSAVSGERPGHRGCALLDLGQVRFLFAASDPVMLEVQKSALFPPSETQRPLPKTTNEP
jgi:hypothetical protein